MTKDTDNFDKDLEERLTVITENLMRKRSITFDEDELHNRTQELKSAVYAGIERIKIIYPELSIGEKIHESIQINKNTSE